MPNLDAITDPGLTAWDAITGGGMGPDLADFRRRFGETITVAGQPYNAVSSPPTGGDTEFFPDDLINPGDSDLRVFNADPTCPATVGQIITRVATARSYTVIATKTVVLSAVPVALRLYCYRTPMDEVASTADAQRARLPAPPA